MIITGRITADVLDHAYEADLGPDLPAAPARASISRRAPCGLIITFIPPARPVSTALLARGVALLPIPLDDFAFWPCTESENEKG